MSCNIFVDSHSTLPATTNGYWSSQASVVVSRIHTERIGPSHSRRRVVDHCDNQINVAYTSLKTALGAYAMCLQSAS
jgi:hypothetical protein